MDVWVRVETVEIETERLSRGGLYLFLIEAPWVEYAKQDPEGPVELHVYGGDDASLDLYQGAGDIYDYEGGHHSAVLIRWTTSAAC